jgi:DHA3 family tetracycline resistance protein-like MFS transporter
MSNRQQSIYRHREFDLHMNTLVTQAWIVDEAGE